LRGKKPLPTPPVLPDTDPLANWGAKFKADGYSFGIEVILPKDFYTFDISTYRRARGTDSRIELFFDTHKVVVTGRLLYKVREGLTNHTLYVLRQQPQGEIRKWISEGERELDISKRRALVEKIEVFELVDEPDEKPDAEALAE
jgi:hypothetical protein